MLEMMSTILPHPTRIVVGKTNAVKAVDKGFSDNDASIAVKFTVTSKLVACEVVTIDVPWC